jgi:hypothetical protein
VHIASPALGLDVTLRLAVDDNRDEALHHAAQVAETLIHGTFDASLLGDNALETAFGLMYVNVALERDEDMCALIPSE